MYQKSETEKQKGLWIATDAHLGARSRKQYYDPHGWHNRFRQEITNRIEEDIFKPLFDEKQVAPNAPVRILVAMMVLKEGQGISDEQLYEECRFNLKTRSALGLVNMDEEIPVEATIFQLGYHYRGNKSRYRGLSKHRLWAVSRCLWINMRRIAAWIETKEAGAAATVGQLMKLLSTLFLQIVARLQFS